MLSWFIKRCIGHILFEFLFAKSKKDRKNADKYITVVHHFTMVSTFLPAGIP